MSEVSLEKAYSLQRSSAQTNSSSKSSASNNAFAAILADKLSDSLLEGTVSGASSLSSAQSNSSAVSDMLDYTMMSALSGATDDSSNTEMLLMMIMMMYANSSSNSSGMNAMMASMASMLGSSDSAVSPSSLGALMTGGASSSALSTGGAKSASANALSTSNASLSAVMASASSLAKATLNTQKGTADSSIVQAALTRLGDPYSKAKRGTGDYVDCSYLAKWAYEQVGIALPSTSAAQAKYCHDNGYEISKSELQPGDLVFWSDTSCSCGRWNEIHHVAIYAGNNKVIEAKPSTGEVVLDRIWGENGSDWKIVMYARPQRKSGA